MDLSSGMAYAFLNENHLSGFKGAKFHKGLIFDNELISVMSIGEDSIVKMINMKLLDLHLKLTWMLLVECLNYLKHLN